MSATAAQIAQVRRMIAEPLTTTYSDVVIQGYIEAEAIHDPRGVAPTILDYTTTPPAYTANTDWIATYDLNRAASVLWEEKAAGVAACYDASTDGTDLKKSQKHAQYLKMASRYRAKSAPRVLNLARTVQAVTSDGTLYETTPIVDAANYSVVLNALDPTP